MSLHESKPESPGHHDFEKTDTGASGASGADMGGLRFRKVANLAQTEGALEAKSAAMVAATTIARTKTSGHAAYVIVSVCRSLAAITSDGSSAFATLQYAAIFVSFLCSCANGYDG